MRINALAVCYEYFQTFLSLSILFYKQGTLCVVYKSKYSNIPTTCSCHSEFIIFVVIRVLTRLSALSPTLSNAISEK